MAREKPPFGLRDAQGEITSLQPGDRICFDTSNGRIDLQRDGRLLLTGVQTRNHDISMDCAQALIPGLAQSRHLDDRLAQMKDLAGFIGALHGLIVVGEEASPGKNRQVYILGKP